MNLLLVLEALNNLLTQAAGLTALIKRAREEGRDITEDELSTLAAQDDSAREALNKAISARKGG